MDDWNEFLKDCQLTKTKRFKNALLYNFKTPRDILMFSIEEISKMRCIGPVALKEIKRLLNIHGHYAKPIDFKERYEDLKQQYDLLLRENNKLIGLFFDYKKVIKNMEEYFIKEKDRKGFEKLKHILYTLWMHDPEGTPGLRDKLVKEAVSQEFYNTNFPCKRENNEEGIYGFKL